MFSILGEVEAMQKLGARIQTVRLHRNLSQDYVARAVGVTRPTYRKIEAGDGSVEFRHVARTLGFLGASEALGTLLPEPAAELTLKDLLVPERRRAGKKRTAV